MTRKMRNRPNKRGNRSKNWDFKTFFENRKRTKKMRKRTQNRGNGSTNWEFTTFKTGNGPKKMRKRTQKKSKPIKNWDFKTFFSKPETDPKNEETDQRKRGNRSTNWELNFFLKTGNWPKKWGNGPKKNRKRLKKTHFGEVSVFLGPIPCWGVSIAP